MDPPAPAEQSSLSSVPAVIPVIPPPAAQSVAPPAASLVQELSATGEQKVADQVDDPAPEGNEEPADGYSPNGQQWRPIVNTVINDPRTSTARPRFQTTLVWVGVD